MWHQSAWSNLENTRLWFQSDQEHWNVLVNLDTSICIYRFNGQVHSRYYGVHELEGNVESIVQLMSILLKKMTNCLFLEKLIVPQFHHVIKQFTPTAPHMMSLITDKWIQYCNKYLVSKPCMTRRHFQTAIWDIKLTISGSLHSRYLQSCFHQLWQPSPNHWFQDTGWLCMSLWHTGQNIQYNFHHCLLMHKCVPSIYSMAQNHACWVGQIMSLMANDVTLYIYEDMHSKVHSIWELLTFSINPTQLSMKLPCL